MEQNINNQKTVLKTMISPVFDDIIWWTSTDDEKMDRSLDTPALQATYGSHLLSSAASSYSVIVCD